MGLISSRDFVDLLHVKPYPGDILTTNCKLHVTPCMFSYFGCIREILRGMAVEVLQANCAIEYLAPCVVLLTLTVPSCLSPEQSCFFLILKLSKLIFGGNTVFFV